MNKQTFNVLRKPDAEGILMTGLTDFFHKIKEKEFKGIESEKMSVIFYAKWNRFTEIIKEWESELRYLLRCSDVVVSPLSEANKSAYWSAPDRWEHPEIIEEMKDALAIELKMTDRLKCARCYKHDILITDICQRCTDTVSGKEVERRFF